MDEEYKLYRFCHEAIEQFLINSNIDHSEESFNKMKQLFNNVIDDYGETWYRQSLGKLHK